MARWTVDVPEEIDRTVREYLERQDEEHRDLGRFIEKAVAWRVFEQTVKDIKARNAQYDPDEIQRTVDEAVEHARAHRPYSNVFISALIAPGGQPDQLYQAWREKVPVGNFQCTTGRA
ncbi:MAG: ribbon-helix-helix domain-containing protein [Candidatus Hydrogenedentales bacterium]